MVIKSDITEAGELLWDSFILISEIRLSRPGDTRGRFNSVNEYYIELSFRVVILHRTYRSPATRGVARNCVSVTTKW